MDTTRINHLLKLFMTSQATGNEVEELFEWLKNQDGNNFPDLLEDDTFQSLSSDVSYDPHYWEPMINRILQRK